MFHSLSLIDVDLTIQPLSRLSALVGTPHSVHLSRRIIGKPIEKAQKLLRGSLEGKAQRGQYMDEYEFRCVTMKDE